MSEPHWELEDEIRRRANGDRHSVMEKARCYDGDVQYLLEQLAFARAEARKAESMLLDIEKLKKLLTFQEEVAKSLLDSGYNFAAIG